VAGRAQAFSDPTVIALASERFIPVAENCSPLQRQDDAKGEFFRLVAEQGHYAGRTYPTSTRQGLYCFTADGKVLAAANTRDPQRVIDLLETALQRWAILADGGANGQTMAGEIPDYVPARPSRYPEDGLVLQLVARDLPRERGALDGAVARFILGRDPGRDGHSTAQLVEPWPATDTRQEDWRKYAWNLDYAWFSRDEAQAMVPQPRATGSQQAVPREIVRRLARFHLRDFVRGEPSVWPEEAIRHSDLQAEIVNVSGHLVRLVLRGRILLRWEARWVRPEDGEERRSDCGFDATLYGEATWDAGHGAFVAFDLLAAGPRWGTNQYNNRADDLGPAPLGIAFGLAGSEPRDRTPPHTIYHRDYFAAGGH
jgi:hypothetical protein